MSMDNFVVNTCNSEDVDIVLYELSSYLVEQINDHGTEQFPLCSGSIWL